MNLEKTSLIIKKINRLYELIQSFGEASNTEKDLLKAYVLDLYDAVLLAEPDEPIIDLEEDDMKDKLKKHKKTEKKLKKQLDKKARAQIEEEEEDEESDSGVIDTDQTTEAAEEESDNELKLVQSVPEAMKELFDFRESPELSDRLANAPIRDLTKAMGINEKIFTVNELFDGNKEEMDNILSALNGLTDFEEAKSVLVRSVATKYDWANEHRAKKAKNFIKLVRRRYIA